MKTTRYRLKHLANISVLFVLLYMFSGFHVGSFRGTSIILISGFAAVLNFCFSCLIEYRGFSQAVSFRYIVTNMFHRLKLGIIFIALLIFLSGISMIVHTEQPKQYLIMWSSIAIGALAAYSMPRGEFTKAYVQLLVFISIWSLVVYAANQLFPTIMEKAPTATNHMGLEVLDTFFTVIIPKSNPRVTIHRNFGFFWEPGVYQTFLNLALLIVLFIQDTKLRVVKSIVLLAATLTTFSTVGILASFLILGIYLLKILFFPSSEKGACRRERITAVGLALSVLLFFGVLSKLQPQYAYSVLGKLTDQLTKMVWVTNVDVPVNSSSNIAEFQSIAEQQEPKPINEPTHTDGSLADVIIEADRSTNDADLESFSVSTESMKDVKPKLPSAPEQTIDTFSTGRVAAFWYPFQAFLQSPFLGIGYSRVSELANRYGYQFNTFTPMLFFAENGVLFGLLMCLAYGSILLHIKISWWARLLLALPLFAIISTEGYTQNASFYMLVFWGLQSLSCKGKASYNNGDVVLNNK